MTVAKVTEHLLQGLQALPVGGHGQHGQLNAGVDGEDSCAPPCPGWSIGVAAGARVHGRYGAKVLGDAGLVESWQDLQPFLHVGVDLLLKRLDLCKS